MSKNVSLDEMKQEAIARMRDLKLWNPCVRRFDQKVPVVQFSEGLGTTYDIDAQTEPKMAKAIADFERETGSLVYHAIHGAYEFGECLTLLFVSPHKGEWKWERRDANGCLYAYVVNFDAPDCSEGGTVQVRSAFGGLIRIA